MTLYFRLNRRGELLLSRQRMHGGAVMGRITKDSRGLFHGESFATGEFVQSGSRFECREMLENEAARIFTSGVEVLSVHGLLRRKDAVVAHG